MEKRKATVELQNVVVNKKAVVEELKNRICLIPKYMHGKKSGGNKHFG